MSEITVPDDETFADLEEAMRDVVDPELGINVVDLGLVYGLNLEEGEEGTVSPETPSDSPDAPAGSDEA